MLGIPMIHSPLHTFMHDCDVTSLSPYPKKPSVFAARLYYGKMMLMDFSCSGENDDNDEGGLEQTPYGALSSG